MSLADKKEGLFSSMEEISEIRRSKAGKKEERERGNRVRDDAGT